MLFTCPRCVNPKPTHTQHIRCRCYYDNRTITSPPPLSPAPLTLIDSRSRITILMRRQHQTTRHFELVCLCSLSCIISSSSCSSSSLSRISSNSETNINTLRNNRCCLWMLCRVASRAFASLLVPWWCNDPLGHGDWCWDRPGDSLARRFFNPASYTSRPAVVRTWHGFGALCRRIL